MCGRGRGRGIKRNSAVNQSNITPQVSKSCSSDVISVSKMLAKYSYNANVKSPGGFTELTVKQGEELILINKHPEQPHWCLVRNAEGQCGYAPANYLMNIETKVTALPWLEKEEFATSLQHRAVETINKTELKKYVSAYNNAQIVKNIEMPSQTYECEICCKKFNGPAPYNSHMASKGHKEELELAKYYGRA